MRIRRELFEFDMAPTAATSVADNLYAQHRAIYRSMKEDPIRSYWEGIQLTAPAAMKKDRQEAIQEELEITRQTATDAITSTPEEAPAIVGAAIDAEQEIVDQENDVFFTYRNLFQTYADENNLGLDDEQLEWVAEKATYATVMAELFAQDWKGTAGDLLGYLVAPNVSFIARDVMDMGSWWSSGRNMQQYNRAFRALPVEERLTTFLALANEVKERTPNNLKAMEILTGIISDEEYENIAMNQALDKIGVLGYALDAAVLGAGIARRVANPIRLGKQLKDDITATRVAEEALRSPEVGQAMGVDQVSAAAHLTPVRLAPELFDGATDVTRTQIAKDLAKQQDTFTALENEVLQEGIRPLVNVSAAEQRVTRELGSELGQAVSDIQIVDTTPRGMNIQYKVAKPNSPLAPTLSANAPLWQQDSLRLAETTGTSWREIAKQVGKPKSTVSDFLRKNYYPRQALQGPPAPNEEIKTVFRPFIFDDITGGFKPEQHRFRFPLLRWFSSPAHKFQDESEALKGIAQRSMYQSGKWTKTFNSEMRRINNMAPTDVRNRVAELLEEGNLHKGADGSMGKVFSVEELRGKGLVDEKGIAQYYEFRALMDQAWKYKDIEQANMHMVAGHKMFSTGVQPVPVKPYDMFESARDALVNTNTHRIAILRGPELEIMTARHMDGTINPRLKELMDEGMVLMRPQNTSKTYVHEDNAYNFVLGWKGELTDIVPGQTQMLDYHPGYLPIFYGPAGEANYFGQQVRMANVDGVRKPVRRDTMVYFNNKTDAEAWALSKNIQYFKDQGLDDAAAVARAEKGDDVPFTWKHDREVEREEFDTWYAGGPYTGHRGQNRLVRGLQEDSAEFLDPITSMQRYLDNIANNMPLSAYRIGLEDKWMKHAKEVGAIPKDWFGTFAAARGEVDTVSTVSLSQPVKRFLLDSHDHITFTNRVPTMGEERVQGRFISMAEKLEKLPLLGKDGYKIHTWAHRLAQKDVPGSLRAVTFHFLLGLLSPAQYLVQGSGSAIAMAIDPVNAAKGIPYAMGFHALDQITDVHQRAAVMSRLEKTWPGLSDRYKAWNKTGMHESVIATSGDYRSMINSHPIGVDAWTRMTSTAGIASNKAAFFYKAGELLNRRISFATALERHIAKGGKLDDDGIKQAMNVANDFMLNMDRTMKGDFQKGWWGVPSQFLQVHTKFIESLFNRQFSKMERSRMLAMQIAMYGGMGVPVPFLAENILNRFVDEDTPDEWITLANEGTVGFLFRQMMGFDNELVSRMSIPYGIVDTFNNIFLENPGIWDVLPGASDSIPSRAVELGQAIHRVFLTSQWDTPEIDPVKAEMLAIDFARFVTSGRNAVEAYHVSRLDTKHHKLGPHFHTDGINLQSMIAQGAGFKLSETQDMFTVQKARQGYRDRVTQYSDMFMEHMSRRFNVEGTQGTDGQIQDMEQLLSYLMSKEDNPKLIEDVRSQVLSRVSNPDTLRDKAFRDYIEMSVNELWDYAMSTRSLHRGEQ